MPAQLAVLTAATATDKMSVDAEFQSFVDGLSSCKLRGEGSVRDAVQVINRYQEKFGDSEKELNRPGIGGRRDNADLTTRASTKS